MLKEYAHKLIIDIDNEINRLKNKYKTLKNKNKEWNERIE